MATLTATPTQANTHINPQRYGFRPDPKQYQNYIGGAGVAPASGTYFENLTPMTG